MQCEFNKAELIRLELGIMDRIERAKTALDAESPLFFPYSPTLTQANRARRRLLEANVEQLEALHKKLDGLIAQAEVQERN